MGQSRELQPLRPHKRTPAPHQHFSGSETTASGRHDDSQLPSVFDGCDTRPCNGIGAKTTNGTRGRERNGGCPKFSTGRARAPFGPTAGLTHPSPAKRRAPKPPGQRASAPSRPRTSGLQSGGARSNPPPRGGGGASEIRRATTASPESPNDALPLQESLDLMQPLFPKNVRQHLPKDVRQREVTKHKGQLSSVTPCTQVDGIRPCTQVDGIRPCTQVDGTRPCSTRPCGPRRPRSTPQL